jgi:hypothetical protein
VTTETAFLLRDGDSELINTPIEELNAAWKDTLDW